jgi:hypothetical protein
MAPKPVLAREIPKKTRNSQNLGISRKQLIQCKSIAV